MRITRGVVDGVVDEVKTEYSEDSLPFDPDLATVLLSWEQRCTESEVGWMFPSSVTGRCYYASPIQQTTFVRLDGSLASATSGGTRSDTRTAPGSIWLALRW